MVQVVQVVPVVQVQVVQVVRVASVVRVVLVVKFVNATNKISQKADSKGGDAYGRPDLNISVFYDFPLRKVKKRIFNSQTDPKR